MNSLGIIAEYNPFHKGHLYHLEKSISLSKADCTVAVMSGDFTQRGEPAILDKWFRAEMAIKNGIDLVIELPFVFACNNAEFFAFGALRLLEGLGCISHLSFGSESGEIGELIEVAKALAYESDEFKSAIKDYMSKGLSFPKARHEALETVKGRDKARLIRHPNNILGVEYLKQWLLLDSKIRPLTIKRFGGGYLDGDFTQALASAKAIRKGIAKDSQMQTVAKSLPKASMEVMKAKEQIPVTDSEGLYQLLVYKILSSSKEHLAEILTVSEGLENSLKKAVVNSKGFEELLASVISKRYTESRIRRLMIHTVMSLTKDDFFGITHNPRLYARVLALSKNGARLLRHIKDTGCSTIPIISNINKDLSKDDPVQKVLNYDIMASDIYNLVYHKDLYTRSDYVSRPYVD